MHHRHYRSPIRRGLWSLSLITLIMLAGMVGLHRLERMPYLDAFYFMSMLATGQGPATAPATPGGKLFTAVMAFVSVGTVVASLGFIFGPLFGQLWRVGVEKVEEELRQLTRHQDR